MLLIIIITDQREIDQTHVAVKGPLKGPGTRNIVLDPQHCFGPTASSQHLWQCLTEGLLMLVGFAAATRWAFVCLILVFVLHVFHFGVSQLLPHP